MSTNTKNLNQEVQTLIGMLETQADSKGTDGELGFVPAVISSSKLTASNHTLTEEELSYSAASEEKATLVNELADFQRQVSGAFNIVYPGEKRPEWMKIGSMRYADFFPEFFTELEQDSDLMTFLDHNNINIELAKSAFNEWQTIADQEEQKTQIFRKIERMIDLRGLLIHALRMYDLSTFDIKAQLV